MNYSIVPVILSGGSGTRLWPLSRRHVPKQFLRLFSERTLFSETLDRVRGDLFSDPIVVCNEEHRFLVAESLRESDINYRSILLEPVAKNTAPAIGAAINLIALDNPEALVLVLPSDHRIIDLDSFFQSIEDAAKLATSGYLSAFGVTPDQPNTGYGYLRLGTIIDGTENGFKVKEFVEKPSFSLAKEYLQSGSMLWNSGIYLFQANIFLSELKQFHPNIFKATIEAVKEGVSDTSFYWLGKKAFESSPSLSVDYAIMEQTTLSAVVKVDMGWSDVGSWSAFRGLKNSNQDGNVTEGDVILLDCQNTYSRSEGPLIVGLGISNLVIIATDDSILVIPEDRADEVRDVVKSLKLQGRLEHENSPITFRPWGSYKNLQRGSNFLVKEVVVNPGAKLSLQYHQFRAEHWVVVEGKAKVNNGKEEFILLENESTYIPIKTVHRLENMGESMLRLIEVQSGTYIGEDDIVRLEDDFGRD